MALADTLKARWFYYSLLCILCWGIMALDSKLGSREIPTQTMQYLFTIGGIPVGLALLAARRFRLENNKKGITFALLNGVLSAIGTLALFAAYHTNGNTSVITASSALYPMITVVLAIFILREKFGPIQVMGLGFAAIAIVIFSL